MRLTENFLSKHLLYNLSGHNAFDVIKGKLVHCKIPQGEVVFYSLLLDALMSVSIAPCERVRLSVHCSDCMAKERYLALSDTYKPEADQPYLHEPELAHPLILEVLLSLGATVLHPKPDHALFSITPSMESRLFIRAFQNCRLQQVLSPYFHNYVEKITDNPSAALADSRDPVPAWVIHYSDIRA